MLPKFSKWQCIQSMGKGNRGEGGHFVLYISSQTLWFFGLPVLWLDDLVAFLVYSVTSFGRPRRFNPLAARAQSNYLSSQASHHTCPLSLPWFGVTGVSLVDLMLLMKTLIRLSDSSLPFIIYSMDSLISSVSGSWWSGIGPRNTKTTVLQYPCRCILTFYYICLHLYSNPFVLLVCICMCIPVKIFSINETYCIYCKSLILMDPMTSFY